MNLPWVDVAVIAVVAVSILVGIYRGLVKEILSLAAWIVAAWVAITYGELLLPYVTPYIKQSPVDIAVCYVVVFLAALIGLSIIGYAISKLFDATGLTGIDRSLGSVFGAIRGAVLVGIIIIVARFMALDQNSAWQASEFIGHFEPLAEWLKSLLPADIVSKLES